MQKHKANTAVKVSWKEGDTVEVDGKQGTVRYVYTNGYTLVVFPGVPVVGGIFNNSSTFGNADIRKVVEDADDWECTPEAITSPGCIRR